MGGPILLSSKKIASQARNIANKHRALPPKSLQQGPDLVTFVRENVVNMKKAHREEFKLYSKDALEVLTQYTRLRIAQGREVGKQMKMLTQHVVSSGYRIEEVCRAVSVLERYRCRDSTLLDLISDTVIKDQREVKKTTTPSHELVYVAFKLHHMGLRGTFLSDLYTQLRKRGAWESGFDLKDCQTFLFLAGQQTPPLGMCRAIFDRVVAVMSLGTPFRPKSGAQQHRHEVDTVSTPLVHIMYNLGYVKSGEVKGDLAYMMPILCNFALSSEPNVAEVVRMVRALGRAKISFEVVPELPTLLLGLSEDALCKLTVSDQAGLLQNLTSMLRNGLTENVRGGIPPVAERLGLLPMVEVLLGELSSVESGDKLQSGEFSAVLWSAAAFKHENQLHIQGLCSTLRENPKIISGMAIHNVQRVLVSLRKLATFEEDLVVALLSHLPSLNPKHAAPEEVLLIIYAIGNFTHCLPPRQAEEMGEHLVGFLAKSIRVVDGTHQVLPSYKRNTLAKGLSGLALLEMLPPKAVLGWINENVRTHARLFDEYENSCVDKWLAFLERSSQEELHHAEAAQKQTTATRYSVTAPPTEKENTAKAFGGRGIHPGRRRGGV